ncbi:helix-turn-helix domain-containing protein [Amycolatopsis ultiminotia]|uniref:helix-turn-helix domain-containing protein n=1 Tax=Amycolatopsis ultiminotia TaxID=543629 RepID=UPI003CD0A817
MSIEAINWALKHAPIPPNRRDASSLTIVLIGLANHAEPDGRNAFPAMATLAAYTRLSERSVRYALRNLEQLHLIRPSDPQIIAAYVRRTDRRPNGYDLAMATDPREKPTAPADSHPPTSPSRGHPLPIVHQREGQTTTPRAANNDVTRGKACPRNIPQPSINQRRRVQNPSEKHSESLLPPCGECDARPGDPISTRTLSDADGHVRRCPRCHPAIAPRHPACRELPRPQTLPPPRASPTPPPSHFTPDASSATSRAAQSPQPTLEGEISCHARVRQAS